MTAADLPTVSVAIWTCDQEAFIGQAIDSVLAQNYPLLELVIADDHSSDATPRIVADYARRHPHLINPLLHRGDRSIVKNFNRALSACSGPASCGLRSAFSYANQKSFSAVIPLRSSTTERVQLCAWRTRILRKRELKHSTSSRKETSCRPRAA